MKVTRCPQFLRKVSVYGVLSKKIQENPLCPEFEAKTILMLQTAGIGVSTVFHKNSGKCTQFSSQTSGDPIFHSKYLCRKLVESLDIKEINNVKKY